MFLALRCTFTYTRPCSMKSTMISSPIHLEFQIASGPLSFAVSVFDAVADELPITRSAVLKHILRSMHRMMQSSGSTEGLRGLIDTSLLKSIKKIIEYRELFGSSVLPLGKHYS